MNDPIFRTSDDQGKAFASRMSRAINVDEFTNWLDGFINPIYSTTDFEASVTRNGDKHHIARMNWMDGSKGFPNIAVGSVLPAGEEIRVKVWWDNHGQCKNHFCQRVVKWDLIRPDEKEIISSKTFAGAMIIALSVIIICSIF